MGLLRLLARLFGTERDARYPHREQQEEPPTAWPRFDRTPTTTYTRQQRRTPPPARTPPLTQTPAAGTVLRGRCWVVDGDTIIIDNVRLRLAGIDAPELDHPWGQRSKWAMVQLCKGQIVTARIRPELSYDRVVAECFLSDGRDLAAELVRSGLALDWPKFSGGKYRHLETADARRKLWRADARQKGRLRMSSGD